MLIRILICALIAAVAIGGIRIFDIKNRTRAGR